MTASEISIEKGPAAEKAPPEPSDAELIAGMLAGDEASFTALYRRRQGAVYRFALQMTGSVAVAEDTTQEVFLTLIRQARRFDPVRGSVAAFLYGIARNLVLRRLEQDSGDEGEPDEQFATDADPLADLTRRETVDEVRRAVLSLPLIYREPVVLCDLQDASYEEAAAALDCPVGTVRSRLSRARTMLAERLSGSAPAARLGKNVSGIAVKNAAHGRIP